MTDKSIAETLLNRLLAKCSEDIERRFASKGADICSAHITFEKNRCVRTLSQKSTCNKCIEVCRSEALELKDQTISRLLRQVTPIS